MLICVVITLPISACTSAVAINTAYNSMAARLSSEMLTYADFTVQQQIEIRQRITAFQQWHREQQLPHYVALVNRIASRLASPQDVAWKDIEEWVSSARNLSDHLSQCSPLNQSGELLSRLSTRQIQQIEKSIKDRHQQRVEEYQSETPKQRMQRRQKTIVKWARRSGIRFNQAQLDLLQSTLQQQLSLTPKRLTLWESWSAQLVTEIRDKGHPQHVQNIDSHITTLWKLTERNYPIDWQTNIDLWQRFVFRFARLMTAEQAQRLTKRLKQIANTLHNVQKKSGREKAICFSAVN